MPYRTLQEATEALSGRLVAMIPEHYADDETFANTDLTSAGLFAGLDVNPAKLQAIANALSDDSAAGSLEQLIPALRPDLEPYELVEVTHAVSKYMAGVFAVGYVLGRLHDPEAE